MKKHTDLRILELGEDEIFQRLIPERTTRYRVSLSRVRNRKDPAPAFTLAAAIKIWREMSSHSYDLVSIGSFKTPLFSRHVSLRRNLVSFFKHVKCPAALGIPIAIFLARKHKIPLLAFDMADSRLIEAPGFFLLSKATAYFKRELPQNNWQTFQATTSRSGDVSNIQRQAFFAKNMSKVKPFPLHLGPAAYEFEPVEMEQKKFDIFFAGETSKSTVRTSGLKVVQKMKEMGFRVDLPEERLTREEFIKRIKSSWLIWSPEGSGWECRRHYEAVVHGAVPLINYPTIHRYKPLLHGVHGLYYGCEEDDLMAVAAAALKDKQNLLKMIAQGREHLQSFYTRERILDYILTESGLSGM